MTLYLVQHGESLPSEIDPEEGLSQQGKEMVLRIAEVARSYEVRVDRIFHSPKKRAYQTAHCFAELLKPPEGVWEKKGLKPLDDVAAIVPVVENQFFTMLVGHLPFMSRLASYLLTGNIEPAIFKFQNGGIVCLNKEDDASGWIIKWALMPNIG